MRFQICFFLPNRVCAPVPRAIRGPCGCASIAVVLVVFAIPRLHLTIKIAKTSMTDAPATNPSADAKTGLTGSGNTAESHAAFVTRIVFARFHKQLYHNEIFVQCNLVAYMYFSVLNVNIISNSFTPLRSFRFV